MEQHLKLIVDYIREKKGVEITPIPPQNQNHYNLMLYMSSVAQNYFNTKANGV